MSASLILPFKPYRVDEVCAITGIPFALLDKWMRQPWLALKTGEDMDKTQGLDALQTFAVFVGYTYVREGAPKGRAEQVVRMLQTYTFEELDKNFAQGNTHACLKPMCLVPTPEGPLGARLNLLTLMKEYIHNVKRVFPEG